MSVKVPSPPTGLSTAGKRLWRAVLTDFELGVGEMATLHQACLTLDLIAALQEGISANGVFDDARPCAAVREIRQQRLVYAKLLGQLDLPADEGTATRNGRHRPRHGYGLRAIEGA